MVLANLSHAERLDHDALLDGLSKVTTQKGLIYHQKRETSEKCPNILLERERERERVGGQSFELSPGTHYY